MSVEIRILTGSDGEACWRLRREALEGEPRAFASSVDEHVGMSVELTAQRIQAQPKGNFTLGAFADGAIIGMAGFYREERVKLRHRGVIWGVYVRPGWRGKGVAREMLANIIDRLRTYEDLDHVTLHVTTNQTAARGLYESLGFEVCGQERRALKVGDEYLDQDHMVL